MFSNAHRAVRYATFAAFAAAGLASTIAHAQTAVVNDLGKAWPNAQDVSVNPNWHVYAFERGGVRYIQINDRHGVVHAAIGLVGNAAFALPMGVDAQRVFVTSTSGIGTTSEVIYRDATAMVSIDGRGDGTDGVVARMIAPCDDPAYCNQSNSY
jgi:hypothetical protein